MEVASLRGLWFWRLNSSSSSFCKSAARPFFSAAARAGARAPSPKSAGTRASVALKWMALPILPWAV